MGQHSKLRQAKSNSSVKCFSPFNRWNNCLSSHQIILTEQRHSKLIEPLGRGEHKGMPTTVDWGREEEMRKRTFLGCCCHCCSSISSTLTAPAPWLGSLDFDSGAPLAPYQLCYCNRDFLRQHWHSSWTKCASITRIKEITGNKHWGTFFPSEMSTAAPQKYAIMLPSVSLYSGQIHVVSSTVFTYWSTA